MKIGVIIIGTGKYDEFFEQLYDSFEEYFLPNHKKTYFYLTDSKNDNLPYNVHKFYIPRKGFPYDTLYRYKYFLSIEKEIRDSDVECLYYTDIDMQAVAKMDDEILPSYHKPLVAVAHPGFYNISKGTPETRKISKAFIDSNEPRDYYVAGGFQGGLTNEYLQASHILNNLIDDDYSRGIIPVWNDESMWNRFYTSNLKKFKVLTPSYVYPESKYKKPQNKEHYKQLNELKPILLALDKDHKYFRSG